MLNQLRKVYGKITEFVLTIYRAVVDAVTKVVNGVVAFYYACVYLVKSFVNTIVRIVMGVVNALLYTGSK